MTIEQAKAAVAALEKSITKLLQDFQTTTGLKIHSVPVTTNNNAANPVVATVKVQL